ncbi:hypothetical protein PV08_07381 [Exophiala spinifera]|uniref:Bacteriocin-protection protein, YdeI/OmpD-associated family n=1 Tax=Exophiala spinifera TaxID=91928 RepID=A0A0D1ZP71_9EURO|nr:uncharacterized protein PV08_07381 [Exophiala spinifera]KIW14597.1 hypothetical protein PV08_07381 [Exophiala spinifera]
MSANRTPTDLPIYPFASVDEFEAFLDREHGTAPGFYLKLAKKGSGIASISAAEAVEVALCFGWIDGQAKPFDDKFWLARYTPRRAKSIWSQKNVNTVARLLKSGRMKPAGLAAVEAAKADGRWDRAYAGPATITIPNDLADALNATPGAASVLDGMSKTERYSLLWKLHTGSAKTRGKRIDALVKGLIDGKSPTAKIRKKQPKESSKSKPSPKVTSRLRRRK